MLKQLCVRFEVYVFCTFLVLFWLGLTADPCVCVCGESDPVSSFLVQSEANDEHI